MMRRLKQSRPVCRHNQEVIDGPILGHVHHHRTVGQLARKQEMVGNLLFGSRSQILPGESIQKVPDLL